MDFGLDSILEAVGLQNDRAATVAASITGNYEGIQSLGEKRAVNTAAAGENDAIVATQKGVGELQSQENKRKFATAVGSNMDMSSEIMTSLGMQLQQAQLETIKAKDTVAKKQSVSLLDDPLQYIINQVTVGDDINYAEAAQAKSDQIASSLAQINASTQSTALTQNAIAVTQTAASVQAGAQSIRDKANEQAAQIEQTNLLYNVQGIEKVQALDQQQLNNMFNAKSAVNADKSLEIAQAELAIKRENNKLLLQERLDRIEAKQTSAAELADIGNTVNSGRAIMGLAPIPTSKAVQLMKMEGELGSSIRDQYAKGAVLQSTGVKVISNSPGEAAVTIAKSQAPLAPGMATVKDLLLSTLSDVATGKVIGQGGRPVDLKDINAIKNVTTSEIKRSAGTMASNIKMGDANNIYAAPDYVSVLKTTPAVGDTELYKKVISPLVTTGLSEINPQQVIVLATQAVVRGDIDFPTAARDIKTLFSGVAATNNVIKDYARVGLPTQNTFNTTVNINAPFNRDSFGYHQNMKINLLDPNQINVALTKQLAANRIKTLGDVFKTELIK